MLLLPHHGCRAFGAGAQNGKRDAVASGKENAAGVQHLGSVFRHCQHLIIGDEFMATAFGELPGVTFIYAVHVGADTTAAGIKGSGKRHGGGITAAPPQCGNVAASVNPLKARYNDNLSVLQFPQNPAAVR